MARWLRLLFLGAVALPVWPAAAAPSRVVVEDAGGADQPIPPPAATPVDLVVHGRTSTLRSLRIAKLGTKVPPTFAGDLIHNTEGFQWYVSRHFALKAQVPKLDEQAMLDMLLIAELGYPHEVWAVGREPEGIDSKRLPIVYAYDMDALNASVKDDLGSTWNGGGGGVTLHANRVAYNYWTSGGLQYHRRDLLLHENMHMIEMCAVGVRRSPVWLLEGLSHAMGQHVWDSANGRLTMAVLDRAPNNNFYDRGLRDIADKPVTAADFYESRVGDPYRPGVYLLFNQFCWSDPERCRKWQLWRDEIWACAGVDLVGNNRRLMERIFGPPEAFDREWLPWLAARRNTFHWVCWGWEQDGDSLPTYGWPPAGFEYARMDINYAPTDPVTTDPLVLDYPLSTPPALVGPVDRQAAEPSLGLLLDFRGQPDRGMAGVALAGDTFVPILVRQCREVTLDGTAIGLGKQAWPLTAELQAAIRADAGRVGLNLRFGREALTLTLRAGNGQPPNLQTITLPLDAAQAKALREGHMALLAKDGNPRLTPYLDLVRRAPVDYEQPAPAGR